MRNKILILIFTIFLVNILIPLFSPFLSLGKDSKYFLYQLLNITRSEHFFLSLILLFYFVMLLLLPFLWKKNHIDQKVLRRFISSLNRDINFSIFYKYFFFIVLTIPTFILLKHYIDLNRNIFLLYNFDSNQGVLPSFWRYGIFLIIFYMLLVNFGCLFLLKLIKKKTNKNEKIFFYYPILNSIIILFTIVFGQYSNKSCDDLPKKRYCSCIYIEAKKGNHQEAYRSHFNEVCVKYFN